MMQNSRQARTERVPAIQLGGLTTLLLLVSILLATGAQFAHASDSRLANLLRGNIENAGLDTSAVSFEENYGTVTLSGRVANEKQKEALLDLVRRTHGVKDVIDRLETDFDS